MKTLSECFTSLQTWRAGPIAILPLWSLNTLAVVLSGIPMLYFFREIHCDEFKSQQLGNIAPEDDVCRSDAVQRAYSASVASYLAIASVIGILLSGPYGKLSDTRGRKFTMSTGACFFMLAETWHCLCASVPLLRHAYLVQLSAVFKGFGGGYVAITAAQSAFVADTSPPATRSFYLGLTLVMSLSAAAVGPLASAVLLDKNMYVVIWAICAGIWAVYLLYTLIVVRELHVPSSHAEPQNESEQAPKGLSRWRSTVRAFTEPVTLLLSKPVLRRLAFVSFILVFAQGATSVLIVYCDHTFGMSATEAGVIVSISSVARAVSILCILPLFLALCRRFVLKKPALNPFANDEETARLLSAGPVDQAMIQQVPILQELLVCPISLVLEGIGLILYTWCQSTLQVSLASVFAALGAPSTPSLGALVTLAAGPDEIGRVLAGISLIEGAAAGLRSPVMFGVYSATIERAPAAIWWLSAGILISSAVIVATLQPAMFNRAVVQREPSSYDAVDTA